MAVVLLQTVLYAPGPFYAHPLKPLINHLVGDTYGVAYKHFRRDHRGALNVLLHMLCLVFQLLGNALLLTHLNTRLALPEITLPPLPPLPLLVVLTAVPWSLALALAPAPPLVTALSISAIAAAALVPPTLSPQALEAAIIASYVILIVLLHRSRPSLSAAAMWTAWLVLTHALSLLPPSPHAAVAPAVIALVLACAASRYVPRAPTVTGMLASRAGYILTREPLLFLWSCSFSAPLLQGTAHAVTRETATLVNLNEGAAALTAQERETKVAYEWAHVTFFPSLAFQAALESLGMIAPVAAAKAA